mgnify:CR=1 FL=1
MSLVLFFVSICWIVRDSFQTTNLSLGQHGVHVATTGEILKRRNNFPTLTYKIRVGLGYVRMFLLAVLHEIPTLEVDMCGQRYRSGVPTL